jgi:hypothetical protein
LELKLSVKAIKTAGEAIIEVGSSDTVKVILAFKALIDGMAIVAASGTAEAQAPIIFKITRFTNFILVSRYLSLL